MSTVWTDTAGRPIEVDGYLIDSDVCPYMTAAVVFNNFFHVFTLNFGELACGGVSQGWKYGPGPDVQICSSGGHTFKVREIVYCCDPGIGRRRLDMVVVIDGIQDSYSTEGGTLNALSLVGTICPRYYHTQTPSLVFLCNTNDQIIITTIVIPTDEI